MRPFNIANFILDKRIRHAGISVVMDLSAIIKAVLDPFTDHSKSAVKELRSGDRLIGRVHKLASDGRAVMDFGQFRARVHIRWPVQHGQKLNLEVVETGPQVKLRVISDSGGSQKIAMPYLDFAHVLPAGDQKQLMALTERLVNSSQPVRLSQRILDALTQLKAVFQPLPISGESSIDDLAHRLRHTFEDSGLLFEKKLAEIQPFERNVQSEQVKLSGMQARPVLNQDLKAQLLILKSYFTEIEAKPEGAAALSGKELAFMRRSAEQLLAHLQDQQGRVMARIGDNDQIVIVNHQLYLENQRSPIQIKLYYPKKEHRRQRPGQYRLAILLNMERLGPVRIDVAMLEDVLEVGFFVESESVRSTLEARREQIVTALQEGFRQVQMVARISHDKITNFQREDHSDPAFGRVDIQI
jgi:hypothetical protein